MLRLIQLHSVPNFSTTSTRQIPLQSFGVSFTYKFGKLEFKKDKGNQDNNDNAVPGDTGGR